MTDESLSEQGQKEAEELMSRFADRLRELADEVLGNLEVKFVPHLETDAWLNYRETLRSNLSKIVKEKILNCEEIWARELRNSIFEENKEALVPALNKDFLYQIEKLKEDLKWERERR